MPSLAALSPAVARPHPDEPHRTSPGGARAVLEALTADHHLAVLEGPDAGLVVPLVDGRDVGRGAVLTDPALSRTQLRVRLRGGRVLVSDPGSRNGTVILRRGRGRRRLGSAPTRLVPGDRVRAGGTVLELRTRPTALAVPVPPGDRAARWAVLVPVVAVLAMAGVAVVGTLTGSRGLLGSLMVVPMLLMAASRLVPALGGRGRGARATAGWRGRRGREPDPAGMLLAVASGRGRAPVGGGPAAGAGSAGRDGETIRAWAGRRRRRSVIAIGPGDAVALRGPGASRALAWWVAQAAARGDVVLGAAQDGLRLRWPRDGGCATVVAVEAPPPGAADALRDTVVAAGPLDGTPAAAGPGSAVGSVRARGAEQGTRSEPRQPAALGAHLVRRDLPASVSRVLDGNDPGIPLTERWMRAVLDLALTEDRPEAPDSGLPGTVRLSGVTGEIDRERVARSWSRHDEDLLPAVLGVREGGALRADLVADGPHALLAGTTGSGKSELLTSWVLQLCLAQPPERLALVLVDYKGGAAFDPLRGLPHVAGVLTDLDPAGTWRALSSLRAEGRRRERVLARAGAKDVGALPRPDRLPRLVVVVDEFATLAAEHPDVLDALVRVAAQGRSLGIHLVLATQRPQGAVTPSIRANTTLRVCLRVLDPADSRDVLGHDGAARLERVPGRVLVAGAAEDAGPRPAQAPWAGRERDVAAAVREIAAAARGRGRPFRPWAAPLPCLARRAAPSDRRRRGPVLLALTDLPEEQRLGRWSWEPTDPLLVLGSSRSGRTSALGSAARGAALRGLVPQLCGAAWERLGATAWTPGTVVGPRDPRRLARLWRLALDGDLAGDLLVLDDAESLVVAVDEQLGPGEGQAMLDALVRTLPSLGTGLVVSASLGAATTRWAGRLPTRLVLGAPEPAQASVAGLPRGVTTGRRPGAGVLLEVCGTTACQVVLPGRGEGYRGPDGGSHRRLKPLPLAAAPVHGSWAVGGDGAAALAVPAGSVLVVGPRGSGRSTALAALARARRETGLPEALLLDDLDLASPQEQSRVEEALAAGRTVLAAATTERCAGTYRGPLAVLRERADLLVLRPGSGPSAQVAGTPLRAVVDVRAPAAPGRGALVARGTAVPVQVVHR